MMNDSTPEWTDGSEFFSQIGKEWKLNICLSSILLLPTFFPIYYLRTVYGEDLCCYFGILFYASFGLIVYTPTLLPLLSEIKKRRNEDQHFLKCDWCSSHYSQEIWKEVARYLEEKELDYTLKIPYMILPVHHVFDLTVKEEGIRFSQYGPVKTSGKKRIIWLAFGISPSSKIEGTGIEALKTEIRDRIQSMPRENPFCQLCPGRATDVCYGSHFEKDRRAEERENKRLAMIDPYKDEKTFGILLNRKMKLKKGQTREQLNELYTIAETSETYRQRLVQ